MWRSNALSAGCAGLLARCRRRRPASLLGLALLAGAAGAQEKARPVDSESGLIKDEAGVWETARDRCTECHSAVLLDENRTDRAGWIRTVRRMESDEGLAPLGDLEKPILDYLAAHYAARVEPTELRRRRAPLRQAPLGDPP